MITITRVTSIDDLEMARNIYQSVVDYIRNEINRYLDDYYGMDCSELECNEYATIEVSVKHIIGDLLSDEEL